MPVLPSSCVSVLLKMSKNIKYIIIYVNVILLDKFSTNFQSINIYYKVLFTC